MKQRPGLEPKTPKKPRRSALVRVARATVGAFVSLIVLYVVAINVFLSTSLFEKVIDGNPETIAIHFERGWSVWLGRIHAEKLTIRGRDSNVEWILKLDEADFDMSFAALAQQRFQVSRVHGRGLSFRLRQRLDAPPASSAEIADLPPIDGFAAYSVRPPPQSSPDLWSDADYHLWTAHLENVIADDVREIWIDHGRFEGRAQILGRFRLKPLRAVEVGPAHVTIAEGRLGSGARALLERLDGSVIDATVTTFDPRTTHGADLLHHVSLATDVRATCPDIARLGIAPPESTITGPLELEQVALRVDEGILKAPTHVTLSAPAYALAGRGHRLAGALILTADIAPESARLTFQAKMTDATLTRDDASASDRVILRAPWLTARGEAEALDLADPLSDLRAHVELDEARVDDVRALTAYIPKTAPIAFVAGHARAAVTLDLALAERRLDGRATLRAHALDVRVAKLHIRGGMTMDASFDRFHWDAMRADDAKLDVHVHDGTLISTHAPELPLARVRGLELHARGALEVADPLRALTASITVPEADILERGVLAGYLPKSAQMRILRGRARFAIACQVTIADHVARGTVDMKAAGLGVAYHDVALVADVKAHACVHDWHWERGDLALDHAKVDLTHAALSHLRAKDTPGEAAVTLDDLHLVAQSPRFAISDPLAKVRLSASLAGRVRDSSALQPFLPERATFAIAADGGAFATEIDAAITRHVAHARLSVRARQIGVRGARGHATGDIEADAEVADWDFAASTLAVRSAHVAVKHVEGGLRDGARDLRVARVEVLGSAAKLDLARLSWRGFDGQLVVEEAAVPDARALAALIPADGPFAFESGSARMSADLTLSSSRGNGHGRVEVLLSRAGVRFHETHFVGDFHVLANLRAFDPAQAIADFSGTRVEMRNVAITGASTATARWGGDLTLDHTTLRLGDRSLDGRFTLDARDASPIFAILLRDNLPKSLVPLTRMPRLHASARFTMGARGIALRDIEAHGGTLAVRGLYVLRDEQARGAFVIAKGPLSVGLRTSDDGAVIRVFGLDGWFNREKRATELLQAQTPLSR